MHSWKTLTIVGMAAVAACLQARPAPAQGLTYHDVASTDSAGLYDRISELESQLAAVQEQMASGCTGGCDDGCGCGDVCENCGCSDCCCGGGLVFGAAAVWIKPRYETNINTFEGIAYRIDTFETGNVTAAHQSFPTDFDLTPRIWLGYETSAGSGVRVTYWEYDHSPATVASNFGSAPLQAAETERIFSVGPGSIVAFHDLDLKTFDIEATKSLMFWGATFAASGGVRYLDSRQTSLAVATDNSGEVATDGFTTSFNGWGPTVSLEAQCRVWRCLGVFANTRQSIVFGGERTEVLAASNNNTLLITNESDQSLAVSEVQLGGEISHETSLGTFLLRGAYEGQIWHDAGGPFNNVLDLRLEGFSFSLGLQR